MEINITKDGVHFKRSITSCYGYLWMKSFDVPLTFSQFKYHRPFRNFYTSYPPVSNNLSRNQGQWTRQSWTFSRFPLSYHVQVRFGSLLLMGIQLTSQVSCPDIIAARILKCSFPRSNKFLVMPELMFPDCQRKSFFVGTLITKKSMRPKIKKTLL